MITIDTSDASAMAIFRRAFPNTNFRSITVQGFRGPMSLNSYWDSGYRDYFAVVPIAAGPVAANIPQNGTPFDGKNLELSALPEGFAVAVHHYAGTRQYGSLYLAEANITKMLPPPADDLTYEEKAVLAVTCGLKSFARRDEAACMGISPAQWEAASSALKARKLLNAAGAITNDGRNLVRTFPGCSLSSNFRSLAESCGKTYRRSWERVPA